MGVAGSDGPKILTLTVAEPSSSLVGSGRAGIDEGARHSLGLELDEVIEITGKRQTLATVRNLDQEDEGKGIIRVDGLVRSNAKVNSGDTVAVRKAQVSPAVELELAPIVPEAHRISFGEGVENFVRRGILNRPLCKGDAIIAPGIALRGGALPFMVVSTRPEGNVTVGEDTSIRLRKTPFRRHEGLSPEEMLQAFVTQVTERLTGVLAEFEESLGTLEGPAGERARGLAEKVRGWVEEFRKAGRN